MTALYEEKARRIRTASINQRIAAARSLPDATWAKMDALHGLVMEQMERQEALTRVSPSLRAAARLSFHETVSPLTLMAQDKNIRIAADAGLAKVEQLLKKAWSECEELPIPDTLLERCNGDKAQARKYTSMFAYRKRVEKFLDDQRFRDDIFHYIETFIEPKAAKNLQERQNHYFNVTPQDIDDNAREAMKLFMSPGDDPKGIMSTLCNYPLSGKQLNHLFQSHLSSMIGRAQAKMHNERSHENGSMDDTVGTDEGTTKGELNGKRDVGFDAVDLKNIDPTTIVSQWSTAQVNHYNTIKATLAKNPDDMKAQKQATAWESAVLPHLVRMKKVFEAAVADRKRAMTYMYRVRHADFYDRPDAPQMQQMLQDAKEKGRATLASYARNIDKLREMMLVAVPAVQQAGLDASNQSEAIIQQNVRHDLDAHINPPDGFVDEELPASVAKIAPQTTTRFKLRGLLPAELQQTSAQSFEDEAGAPLDPIAAAEEAKKNEEYQNRLKKRKRMPKLGRATADAARGHMLEVRDRLVDGLYQSHDWGRQENAMKPALQDKDSISLYSPLLFSGFKSKDEYKAFRSGDVSQVPSEAFVSNILLRAMVEAQNEFRLLKSFEVEDNTAYGPTLGIPLVMEAVEREMARQNLDDSQKQDVINFLNTKVFQTAKFVPNATQYYEKLLRAASAPQADKNLKAEAKTFSIRDNSRFYDMNRNLDGMVRAAAYDQARREFYPAPSGDGANGDNGDSGNNGDNGAPSFDTPAKEWDKLTDGELARIADSAYNWLYAGGYREMGVRGNEYHEKWQTQRPNLQSTPKVPFVETGTGRRLHPFTAAMRKELKRIRKDKAGARYPKDAGAPYAEMVDNSHPYLQVQQLADRPEVSTPYREKMESWENGINHEIEDGSEEIDDYANEDVNFDEQAAMENAEITAATLQWIRTAMRIARRSEKQGDLLRAERIDAKVRNLAQRIGL